MRFQSIYFMIAILLFSLLSPTVLSSDISDCNESTPGSTEPQPLGSRPPELPINGTVVWYNNSDIPEHNNLTNKTYGFRIFSGASLTIMPGVTLDFRSNRELNVEGALYIRGTAERPVNITSNESNPTPLDWGGVLFAPGSSGYINHSNITYSIIGVTLNNVANIRITNSTIHEVQTGIKIYSNSNNIILDNNSVYNCDTGIAIIDSNENVVFDNNIYNASVIGLSMAVNTKLNTIESNEIHSGGTRGISLASNVNNNTFVLNKIYSNQEDGIRGLGACDNILRSNQIYSNKKNGIIFYSNSNRNEFTKNTFTQNTVAGLAFENSVDNDVKDNTLTNNGYGLRYANSMGGLVENNSISSSTANDLELSESSVVHAINDTFNGPSVAIYDSSLLYVYCYMLLETKDKTDDFISAIVNVTDSEGNVVVSNTSINGKLSWIKCLGYIQSVLGQDKEMNPYWIIADNGSTKLKMGFDMSTGSQTCTVRFLDYPSPESTLPAKFDFSEEKTFILNISKYFTSSEELTYDVAVLSGGNISYTYDPETTKLQAVPPLDWNGEEVIRITVTANLAGSIYSDTTLMVTSVNDPPVIEQLIPNQLKIEGSPSWELDLSGFGSDPDLIYGDSLIWYVSDVNESLLNITINATSEVMTFTIFDKDLNGDDEFIVWLRDNDGAIDYQAIEVNITPENDVPWLNNMGVYPTSGSPITRFNFTVKYYDLDGDIPEYVFVRLDNKTSYEMSELDPLDRDVTDGKKYIYGATLSSLSHFFRFECHDGHGGYNITERLNGPIVTMADKGSLRGKVTDQATHEPITGATITLRDTQNSSVNYTTLSDGVGDYAVINLPPGIDRYNIFATVYGYKDSDVSKRTIIKGGVSILDFELERLPEDIIDTPITKVWIVANRTNITVDSAISFSGYAEDLDEDILEYYWNFDDRSDTVSGEQVSHTFHQDGTFNISLTVSDTDGNGLNGYLIITVHPKPFDNQSAGDGDDSKTGSDNIASNYLPLLAALIIVIIIIIIVIFLQLQRKRENEAIEHEEYERARARAERERDHRTKRKNKYGFVDKDKRNSEQVNLAIHKLHRSRRGKGKCI